jgi:hypothetical protein
MPTKRALATLAATGTLALVPAVPAMASPVATGGLVNVLATQLGSSGPISCTNPTTGQSVITQLQ